MNFIIFLAIVGAIIFYVIGIYNKLISNRIKVDEGWSGIDVQLKRRHDLIPNIVSTVKGFAEHEKELFTEVTEARNMSRGASGVGETAKAESALNFGLGRLLAVAENYPEIKADKNFLNLQEELTELEDSIQHSRRYYNGCVRDYMMSLETFPSNLIAQQFQFEPREYFELEDPREKANPKVEF